ncbi:large-conductance mechanosensitive channel protein MscL [Paenibacillus marinisediminis]
MGEVKQSKIRSLATEFKEFAMRGNVIDLAVGVIIGTAFNKIVTSIVNDLIMPPIGYLIGNVDFKDLFYALDGSDVATLADAQAKNIPVIAYGNFISVLIDFLLIALSVFFLVKVVNMLNRSRTKDEPAVQAEPTTKKCPYCITEIAIEATRCPHCTSTLEQAAIGSKS